MSLTLTRSELCSRSYLSCYVPSLHCSPCLQTLPVLRSVEGVLSFSLDSPVVYEMCPLALQDSILAEPGEQEWSMEA